MTREEKIKKIAKHYGYEKQNHQLFEEIGELMQASNKYWWKDLECGENLCNPWDGYMPEDSEEYFNLVEEITDVQIILDQMKFFLAANEQVERSIDFKLDRQLARIEEEKGC